MTANELRENCREYYWQEIQVNEKLKAQYEDIVKKNDCGIAQGN